MSGNSAINQSASETLQTKYQQTLREFHNAYTQYGKILQTIKPIMVAEQKYRETEADLERNRIEIEKAHHKGIQVPEGLNSNRKRLLDNLTKYDNDRRKRQNTSFIHDFINARNALFDAERAVSTLAPQALPVLINYGF